MSETHTDEVRMNEIWLFCREYPKKALKLAICLPVAFLILGVTVLGDLLAGVKNRDKWAKLKETKS